MSVVTVSTTLLAPADVVWDVVQAPEAFRYVTRGLVSFPAADGVSTWQEGETVSGPLRLFGVLPVSRHHITLTELDPVRRRLRTHEHGGLIRAWIHDIEVDDHPSGRSDRCRYTDRIDIDAGWATVGVAAFARVFYRIRQSRWRRVARLLAATRRTTPSSSPIGGTASRHR
jgi:hypothetical protein